MRLDRKNYEFSWGSDLTPLPHVKPAISEHMEVRVNLMKICIITFFVHNVFESGFLRH